MVKMWRPRLIACLLVCPPILLLITLSINNILIYWNISRCIWPSLEPKGQNMIKVMFIADTHMKVKTFGNYLENSLREFQMYSNFEFAINMLRPEIVFILGDVFDDGESVDDQTFQTLVNRHEKLFSRKYSSLLLFESTVYETYSKPKLTKYKTCSRIVGPDVRTVAGNHDIGFHYTMTKKLKSRFDVSFGTDSVKLIRINDINFVTINSITLEGDYCMLCSDAERKLKTIGSELCSNSLQCSSQMGPIVLTHFPFFRLNDNHCGHDWDSMPESLKYEPFVQKWDCLSENATKLIIDSLKPRFVITGHTHYGCVTRHTESLFEWTVSSFNYRNIQNPSLLLAKISKTKYSVIKCILINEWILYFVDFIIITTFSIISFKILFRKRFKYNYYLN